MTRTYKAGDRVRVIDTPFPGVPNGWEGVVERTWEAHLPFPVRVRLDGDARMRSFSLHEIEPVESTPVTPEQPVFQPGDKVVYTAPARYYDWEGARLASFPDGTEGVVVRADPELVRVDWGTRVGSHAPEFIAPAPQPTHTYAEGLYAVYDEDSLRRVFIRHGDKAGLYDIVYLDWNTEHRPWVNRNMSDFVVSSYSLLYAAPKPNKEIP